MNNTATIARKMTPDYARCTLISWHLMKQKQIETKNKTQKPVVETEKFATTQYFKYEILSVADFVWVIRVNATIRQTIKK